MNSIAEALTRATPLNEATAAQPMLLEVPGTDIDTLKAELATSGSEQVRFSRVADLMASVAGEIKVCKDSRTAGGHIRRALVVAAAAMPNHQLTAQDSLVEEWRAANAKIDVLEEEKSLLEQQVTELTEQVGSLEDKLHVRNRHATVPSEDVLRFVNNSNPMRVNFVFDRATGCLIEIPQV